MFQKYQMMWKALSALWNGERNMNPCSPFFDILVGKVLGIMGLGEYFLLLVY
jgi:hypothetical protein